MSFFMAFGMEVYNISIQMGYNLTFGIGYSSITYAVFAEALKDYFSRKWDNVTVNHRDIDRK